MVTIILASHKYLAKGMKSTAEYIIGDVSFIKEMNAYTADDYDIQKEMEVLLEDTDRVIVVTDIIGGSVNNAWMTYVYEKHLEDKVTILSGMTLSLVMELCINITNDNFFDSIPHFIEQSKNSIINCTELIKENELE